MLKDCFQTGPQRDSSCLYSIILTDLVGSSCDHFSSFLSVCVWQIICKSCFSFTAGDPFELARSIRRGGTWGIASMALGLSYNTANAYQISGGNRCFYHATDTTDLNTNGLNFVQGLTCLYAFARLFFVRVNNIFISAMATLANSAFVRIARGTNRTFRLLVDCFLIYFYCSIASIAHFYTLS